MRRIVCVAALVGTLCPSLALAQDGATQRTGGKAGNGQPREVTKDSGGWEIGEDAGASDAPRREAPASETSAKPTNPGTSPGRTTATGADTTGTKTGAAEVVVVPAGSRIRVESGEGSQTGGAITINCDGCRLEGQEASSPKPRKKWYGWQTLVLDLGIWTTFAASVDRERPPMELYLTAATLGAIE